MRTCLMNGHGLVRIVGVVNYRGEQLYMCWYCKARPLVKRPCDSLLRVA